MTTIGIIGAGAVAHAVATALITTGLADTLLLASRTRARAEALAADVADHSAAVRQPTHVQATDVATLTQDCEATVVALRETFTNTHTANIRMAGLRAHADAVAELSVDFSSYAGALVVVTNPVDVLTRLLSTLAGNARVYGVGSALDTARYRSYLATHHDVPVSAVDGHVIGEHGDAAVICASSTRIHGHPITVNIDAARHWLRDRPRLITSRGDRVRSGAAGTVVSALQKILGHRDGLEELSTPTRYGCLGVPLRFQHGHAQLAMPTLDTDEHQAFLHAQHVVEAAYQHLSKPFAQESIA